MSETTAREKPILFSGPMVRAILAGQKTQTRRVVKPQPERMPIPCHWVPSGWAMEGTPNEYEVKGCSCSEVKCPYYEGLHLWVRETWCELRPGEYIDNSRPRDAFIYNGRNGAAYRASCDEDGERCRVELGYEWRHSIFMPRWASRITLEVTEVRCERLHEITEADALAEGFESTARDQFADLWDRLNGKKHPWESNPWVFVYTFRRITHASP